MNPTTAHARLDALGLLDDSHGAATYALVVAVPDSVEHVQRQYLDAKGHPLDDALAVQLATAETCLYVGRSGDAYSRIMDHARGDVRKASLLEAFAVEDVVGVWPSDENSDMAERDRARDLSSATTAVWANGELF